MRYICFLLLAASCSPIYIPNTTNAPLFREQGETQIGAYVSSGGLDGQLAYAITDHIGVIGNYSYWSSKKNTPNTPNSTTPPNTEYTHKHNYAEVGLGYFDRTRSSRFEIYAGYGVGQGTTYDQYYFFKPYYGLDATVSTGKMTRIFFQPTIGTNNRDVNLSFTPRLAWVNFSEFTSQAGVVVKPNEKTVMFIEPTAILKMRLAGNLHGIFQLGVTFPSGDSFFKYQSLQAAIGIQIDTGGMRTKVY